MICTNCKAGADLWASTPAEPTVPTWPEWQEAMNQVAAHHAACLGGTWCDCQHRGTPSERQAVSA
jgi:hypothetical protein